MPNKPNQDKPESNEISDPKNVEIDGFSAAELGEEASAYADATEIAQQMRRGDETQGDPNDRDIVGASDAGNAAKKPFPGHQRGADDQADKSFATKEN